MKEAALLALALGALLLCLAARGSPLQEEEEELVVPVRLDSQQQQQQLAGGRLYSLDAFGERLHLELQPDSSFLAPDLTLQYVGSRPQEEAEAEEASPAAGAALASCFYSGTVNGDAASAAAFSLCGGMRGAFYWRGVEYLIQPTNDSIMIRQEDQLQLHVLRRRLRRRSPSQNGGTTCGVTDSPFPSATKGQQQQPEHVPRAGNETRERLIASFRALATSCLKSLNLSKEFSLGNVARMCRGGILKKKKFPKQFEFGQIGTIFV